MLSMNRRAFTKFVVSTPGLAIAQQAEPTVNRRTDRSMASLDLARMRDQYRKDLFEDYLPFHERFVNDKQFGGFLCSVRPTGELVSDEKRVWYEGRGTWVYSFLYNHLAREQKYLDIAAASVRLLARSKPQHPDEFRPKTLHRDGSPAGPPDTEVYSDLFVAEGLAEFAQASGDPKYWDEAQEIIRKCVRRYDKPDYCPDIGKTYLGAAARAFPGARVQGVWMVLLRATTQMLRVRADAELQKLSDRCIDAVINRHYNPRFKLINELINHDGSRPTNEYEQLVYAGHAIETLWMLMDEALRRSDASLFDRTSAMFQRHCEVSRDRVYGGLLRNLTNVDQNAWTLDKTLFPHQEALIGSLMLIEQRNDPWAQDFYPDIDQYTRSKFPLRSVPSPLWQVIGNRQVDPTPDMTRAENYHHPRFLMLNLLAVERMIAKKGTTVGGR
jgi:mannose/cellobiose epimerase-like protein (N-acyl-D-glucosamine 2-epimerase family)